MSRWPFPYDLADSEAAWVGEPAAGRWRYRYREVRFRVGEWSVAVASGRRSVSFGFARPCPTAWGREDISGVGRNVVGAMVGREDGRFQLLVLTERHIVRRGIDVGD